LVRLIKPAKTFKINFTPPGDKSITHRAMILAGIAKGECVLRNFSNGRDCLSTIQCLEALGVKSELQEQTLIINGGQLREPQDVLNANNSGTTLRLLCGLLAGQNFLSFVTGDRYLRKRPVQRVIEPLKKMGAEIWARDNSQYPPLAINGKPLMGINYQMPVASAQVKSALLLAGLAAEGKILIGFDLPSRDHTERMLKSLGAQIILEKKRIELNSPFIPPAFSCNIPGDFSASAFFITAGVLLPNSEVIIDRVGLNPTRTAFLEVLTRMGAVIKVEKQGENLGEPFGAIMVKTSDLKGITVTADEVPLLIDELMLFGLLGAKAQGVTRITGAQELRVKESDRIKAVFSQLNQLGIPVIEHPDGFSVEGPVDFPGGRAESLGDHRVAMLLGLCGLLSQNGVEVYGFEWADISFPGFWELLNQASAGD